MKILRPIRDVHGHEQANKSIRKLRNVQYINKCIKNIMRTDERVGICKTSKPYGRRSVGRPKRRYRWMDNLLPTTTRKNRIN